MAGRGAAVLGGVGGVAGAQQQHRLTGPARERGRVPLARRGRIQALQRRQRRARLCAIQRGRQQVRRQRRHCPVVATRPGALEDRQFDLLPLGLAAVQQHGAALAVVADGDRVMPHRRQVQRQVLEHDHRMSGRELGQQRVQPRRQHVGGQALAARGHQHLGLQRALAARQEDLRLELLHGRGLAGGAQQHRERGRAAFIVVLRDEGRLRGQVHARRQVRGPLRLQRLQLRRRARAAPQQQGQRQRGSGQREQGPRGPDDAHADLSGSSG